MTISARLESIQNLHASHSMISTLEESKASIERLVDDMPDAIFIFDMDERVLKANREACLLLRTDAEFYLSSKVSAIFDQEGYAIFQQKLRHVKDHPKEFEVAHQFELPIWIKDEIPAPYLWSLRPLEPADFERLPLFVLCGRNLADIKSFNKELAQIYSSISLGIMTIDSQGLVEPFYSLYCEFLLQHQHYSGINNGFARTKFEELIFLPSKLWMTSAEADGVELIRKSIGELEIWFESVKAQFPQLLRRPTDHGELWIKIDYFPVVHDGIVTKILMILENRTEVIKERFDRNVWIQKNESSIRRILEVQNAEGADGFCFDIDAIVHRMDHSMDDFDFNDFKLGLEGLKIAAEHAGFRTLYDLVHLCLAKVTRADDHHHHRGDWLKDYAVIRNESMELVRIYSSLYSQNAVTARLNSTLFQSLTNSLDAALAQLGKGDINQALKFLHEMQRRLKHTNLEALSNLEPFLATQAKQMEDGKVIRLQMEWENLGVFPHQLKILRSMLTILLEQSIVFGIESTPTRRLKNKPEFGLIQIKASQESLGIRFRVTDDGRGISVGKIKEIFVMRGIIDKSNKKTGDEIFDLVFQSDFLKNSNASTHISGKLEQVKTLLEQLSAQDIKLRSKLDRGVSLEFLIPENS